MALQHALLFPAKYICTSWHLKSFPCTQNILALEYILFSSYSRGFFIRKFGYQSGEQCWNWWSCEISSKWPGQRAPSVLEDVLMKCKILLILDEEAGGRNPLDNYMNEELKPEVMEWVSFKSFLNYRGWPGQKNSRTGIQSFLARYCRYAAGSCLQK